MIPNTTNRYALSRRGIVAWLALCAAGPLSAWAVDAFPPAAAAPPNPAAAQAAPTGPIMAGDMVYIEVYRRPELSSMVQVDANGNVTIPYVGNIQVAGASEEEASNRVTASLTKILKNPRATVTRSVGRLAAVPQASGGRTAEMKTQVINLNNARAEVLYEALQGMTSPGGNLGFDPNTNTLIITDTPSAVQNMLSVIGQLDKMQSQVTQVRIETKIAEVKEGAMKELGVRWFAKGNEVTGGYYPSQSQDPGISSLRQETDKLGNESVSGGGGNANNGGYSGSARRFVDEGNFDRRLQVPVQIPLAGQMFFGLLNEDIDLGAILDALVADNKAQTLAEPMILTVNHKTAQIKMADEYPFQETTMQSYGARESTEFMDLGIKLEVTPHVYRDQGGVYVQLDLRPEVSFYNGMSNGVPIRGVRSTQQVANVRDGQTLVIGGIVMKEERNLEQRVPGVGNIPVIGNLFKHKEKAKERRELMVFATPTVHDSPESITWDRMLDVSAAHVPGELPAASADTGRETRKE